MSGRGTSGGVVFQAEVGACVAGLLLAERPLTRLANGLPGIPKKLFFEVPTAVDDILIQTDCGEVYIQAKRTISLSTNPDGELASVADQFVRQYQQGTYENGPHRPLEMARDRLVLAVGTETPTTITHHLREALDRNRTGAATGIPSRLLVALQTFTTLLQAAWLQTANEPLLAAELQALLSTCCVIVISDDHRQLLLEVLRPVLAIAGEETTLFDLLVVWAADASQHGTGGDVAAIYQALRGKVQLLAPPSYQSDVSRLTLYSTAVIGRLGRFATLVAPEGNVTVRRPVVDLVATAAREGSLALIGEPGAGKSAVMHQLAQDLGRKATVITLTVEGGAQTMELLSREIGLIHPLPEVLQQLPIIAPAYLLLDALDAVRGSVADSIYRRLVEEVAALPGWRVVVSVRTFDLRLGREWRRLFAGTPPLAEYADPGFMVVRHVHIGLLTEEEQAAVAVQSPTLGTAISTGNAKLVALTRNFFNLALLGDLLRAQPARSLATVVTRGELLERYWEERIQEFSTPATVSLKKILEQMLAAQSLNIPETAIEPSSTSTVRELQRVGVLVLESTQRIGFRHHVLFDYAVAKLLLLPDETTALHYLERTSGAGLLVSPSLDYWVEALKKSLPQSRYWFFVASLISNVQLDLLIRIGVARIAAESVQEHEDLSPLIEILGRPDPTTEHTFSLLAGALLTRLSFNQPVATGPWANLLACLPVMRTEQLGSVRNLIGSLLDTTPDIPTMNSLGIAARRLFDLVSADEGSLGWLAPQAVTYVARTYGTSITASCERLTKLFEPEHFARYGYIEVPWLAQQVLVIAQHDIDFAAQLFYLVFRGGHFSREQVTSLSRSWIIGMSSNAAQDFAMAPHSLAQAYPELLRQFPRVAIRAFGATLRGVSEPELTHGNRPAGEVLIGTVAHTFADDSSYIWAWEVEEGHHTDYATVYQEFVEWVPTIEDHGLLAELPTLVLQETGTALAWRALFTVAAIQLDVLGQLLWRAAATAQAISSLDTRQSAVNLIAAIYPRLTAVERQTVEAEWLRYDFADFVQPTHIRNQVIGTLFYCLKEENLATAGARDFLQETKGTNSHFENSNSFDFYRNYHSCDSDSEPVDTASKVPTVPLLVFSNEVRRVSEKLRKEVSLEHVANLWKAVKALDNALRAAGEILEASTECEASDALAEGLGLVLAHNGVPAPDDPKALTK